MKYRAVLFDMDGTVLDTLDDLYDAVNHSLAQFSQPQVSLETVRAGLGNGARHLIKYCLPAGSSDELHEEVLAYYMPYYDDHCRVKTKPYTGIIPLMESLREQGVKVAIVSNKPDRPVKELAKEFFPGMLETAVGESAAVRRKPAPDTVLAAAKLMDVPVEDCVYVGDSEVDVQTAINAGMDCIAVSWGFRSYEQLVQSGAKNIANTREELKNMLQ